MAKMKHFTIKTLSRNFQVIEWNGNAYLCKDMDVFLAADTSSRNRQALNRVAGNMFFNPSLAVTHNTYADPVSYELQVTLTNLGVDIVHDDQLIRLVNLIAGSDNTDFTLFADTVYVKKWEELKEMGSNLSSGLGFAWKGYSLLVVEDEGHERGRKSTFRPFAHIVKDMSLNMQG